MRNDKKKRDRTIRRWEIKPASGEQLSDIRTGATGDKVSAWGHLELDHGGANCDTELQTEGGVNSLSLEQSVSYPAAVCRILSS